MASVVLFLSTVNVLVVYFDRLPWYVSAVPENRPSPFKPCRPLGTTCRALAAPQTDGNICWSACSSNVHFDTSPHSQMPSHVKAEA